MKSVVLVTPDDSGSLGSYEILGAHVDICLANEIEGAASQWFFFQVLDHRAGEPIHFSVLNEGRSLYPRGWINYRPVYSSDGHRWERVDAASFTGKGTLEFVIQKPPTSFFVAWYEPYTLTRFLKWISRIRQKGGVNVDVSSNDFISLTMGRAVTGSIVIIARQHPGETMASFFIEGLLNGLLEYYLSPSKASLLELFEVKIYPLMNPAGVRRGRHRYSEGSVDFNRSWMNDNPPIELQQVKRELKEIRALHCFFDIHGDEVTQTPPSHIELESGGRLSKPARVNRGALLDAIRERNADLEVVREPFFATRLRKFLSPGLYPAVRLSAGTTATRFVTDMYAVPAFTYEISAHNTTGDACATFGRSLATALARYAERWSGA